MKTWLKALLLPIGLLVSPMGTQTIAQQNCCPAHWHPQRCHDEGLRICYTHPHPEYREERAPRFRPGCCPRGASRYYCEQNHPGQPRCGVLPDDD